MRPYLVTSSLMLSAVLSAAISAAAEKPEDLPEHRVVAMYFHRTQRCPTCKRISAYIEEAIQTGFVKELKNNTVSLHLIDYQNRKNVSFTKAYKIEAPTLVLADVRQGKVTMWKPMPMVWSFVAKKKDFLKYVQDGVRGYLEEKK